MLDSKKKDISEYLLKKFEEFDVSKNKFGELTGIPAAYFSNLNHSRKFDKIPTAVWDYLAVIYDNNKFAKVVAEDYPVCKAIQSKPRQRIEPAISTVRPEVVEKRKEKKIVKEDKIDSDLLAVLQKYKDAGIKVTITIEV